MPALSDLPPQRTRDRIVASADRLFYESGYHDTSFAAIAAVVGISRGNFHHHFKTKDEILTAVIDRRRDTTRAMLAHWEAATASPTERIGCFIDMVVANQVDIFAHGCPVGSLCSELAKADHPHLDDAGTVFELFRDWLRHRFIDLGLEPDADDLALHLLTMSQGVAVLANVFKDPVFVAREVAAMHDWLDAVLSAGTARPPQPGASSGS